MPSGKTYQTVASFQAADEKTKRDATRSCKLIICAYWHLQVGQIEQSRSASPLTNAMPAVSTDHEHRLPQPDQEGDFWDTATKQPAVEKSYGRHLQPFNEPPDIPVATGLASSNMPDEHHCVTLFLSKAKRYHICAVTLVRWGKS